MIIIVNFDQMLVIPFCEKTALRLILVNCGTYLQVVVRKSLVFPLSI